MKKRYFSPALRVRAIENENILAASGNGVSSDSGIGSGDVDHDGTKDPEAKTSFGVWDDEE